MEPTQSSRPPTVRGASARLAAVQRWHPADTEAIRQAKRDLLVAHAAVHAGLAAALLTQPTGPGEAS